jgi:hypothetical protein
MISKLIDALIFVVFIGFAYLQLNDPDPWFWILTYLLVAIIAAMSLLGRLTRWRVLSTLTVFALLVIINFFKFIAWGKAGFPDIINYTPDTVSVVEGIREFSGLLISFSVVLLYQMKVIGRQTQEI